MANRHENSNSQLFHKDVRIRRKAVRTLFDEDNPESLHDFIPLLDDKDAWFRKKSLDAHRKWATKHPIDCIIGLASHKSVDSRRCAANLLEEFDCDTSSVAKILYHDEDELCRLKACKALIAGLDGGKYIDEFLNSDDEKIKILAISSAYVTDKQLFFALKGISVSIKEMALNELKKRNMDIDEKTLLTLFSEKINKKYLACFAVNNGGKCLVKIAKDNNASTRRELVSNLIEKCQSIDDSRIELLIKNDCKVVVGRWLQGKNDAKSDMVRWNIIEDNNVDEIERSRLLERLIGRCNETEIIERALKLEATTNSELLKIIAHNLSTAGNSE